MDANAILQSHMSFQEIVQQESINKIILDKIALKAKEAGFISLEVPKRISMITKSFAENDCLTASLKFQRH